MTISSPLLQTASTTPTDYWNDSCSVEELTYAIDRGAVGATTNPNIVLNVLTKEMLMERRANLQADMNAIAGAIQQIDWTLEQMEHTEEDSIAPAEVEE